MAKLRKYSYSLGWDYINWLFEDNLLVSFQKSIDLNNLDKMYTLYHFRSVKQQYNQCRLLLTYFIKLSDECRLLMRCLLRRYWFTMLFEFIYWIPSTWLCFPNVIRFYNQNSKGPTEKVWNICMFFLQIHSKSWLFTFMQNEKIPPSN